MYNNFAVRYTYAESLYSIFVSTVFRSIAIE